MHKTVQVQEKGEIVLRCIKTREKAVLVAAVLGVGAHGAATAQPADDAAPTLAPIVVTATSGERALRDAPASISVVEGDTLRERPVRNLADALEGEPGVGLAGIGMGRRGVSIRGMRPDHSLFLVDGMRISNSSSAVAHSDFELGWVPAVAIERIEVVRGPMSSLYGSEALGGVVNVITRAPTDTWRGELSSFGAWPEHSRGGDLRTAGAYVSGPLLPGVLGMSLWGQFQHQDAMVSAQNPRRTSMGEQEAFNGNMALTWTPDAQQRIDLSYGAGKENRWRDTMGAGRYPRYYRSEEDLRRTRLALSHEGKWGWGDSRVRVYRTTLSRDSARTQGAPVWGSHRFVDTVGDAQVAFSPLAGHRFTLGGEVRGEHLEDPTVNHRGKASQTHFAAFIQDEIVLGDQWELVLGSRFDRHSAFGWEASPRAYLLYHATDALTLKGGVGGGFKAPTLKQLSPEYEAIIAGGRFTIVGNPDLKPEKNLSFEAGVDYEEGIWSARATAFQNDITNLIQAACIVGCTGRPGALWTYQNVHKARIRGVELGGGVELPWSMALDANYTYLDAKDRTTDERLIGRSRHAANATLKWAPLAKLTASVRVNYVGPQKTSSGSGRQGGYSFVSAYGDYALSKHVNLRLGVENIGDVRLADDSDEYAYANPGRRYVAGLQARF
ncbi:TonB-dependent receptor domain-containing protein [Paracandidimonas lactea]|uniref:TonB-dependent receptor domain-containing protein n=1 Tax=Paracandidimonas lactea TaxID=2895524 RepID=UPI001F3B3FC6|nr:TonB-dependent receptor [Paracandidimonas lactea]